MCLSVLGLVELLFWRLLLTFSHVAFVAFVGGELPISGHIQRQWILANASSECFYQPAPPAAEQRMWVPQLPINPRFCGRCDCDRSGRCGACRGSFGIPFLTKNFKALFHMLLTIRLDLFFCEVSISPSGHLPFSLYILDMSP